MVFNGVVLYGGYAQFFHDGEDYDEDCGKYQDWAFPRLGEVFEPLKLTLARRREFNELVRMANDGIQKAIKEQKQEGMRLRVRYVDWDDWASDTRVAGQFCWPKTTGEYPDSSQPMLQFFKPDTKRRYTHDDIKKREVTVDLDHSGPSRDDIEATVSKDLYNSALYKSGNPSAEALHMLDGRDIIGPANCPGADDDKYFGFGLPDRWGKFFHPNTNGHITLASFFLDAVVAARAEIIEVTNPICRDGETDSFECNAEKSDDVELKRYYAAADLVDESYQTYCEEVKPPPNGVNWHDERVFYEGTPEEHTYSISLEHGAFQFSKKQCFDSFLRLIHGCGTSLDANPMNLKHGGMWKKGRYTYKLSMGPKKRPWPIARPTGSCFGEKKIFAGAYTIKGAGWGTLDYGRAVHDESKSCIGRGLTFWDFKYYDESDSDGMEWEATFNTPIWVLWRCFQNNKVFHNIGGPSIGCEGDDHPNVPWH
jgi:predicted NUDIX family NTP pyrophosphohydrolase